MITAGIYDKQSLLNTPAKRDMVLATLFACAEDYDCTLQAWAVMKNHYHFVAATEGAASLSLLTRKLHANTARELNRVDGAMGRRVWNEYWDTHLTYEKSWLARLHYVHTNPEHHETTTDAESYPWCSAAWFAATARRSFAETVYRFKTDRLSVHDDF